MPPKTRSNTTIPAEIDPIGKHSPTTAMAAKGDGEPQVPDVNTDDPNHKLLLDIIANQKSSDEQQESRHRKLNSSIRAHKLSLDKHIEENEKQLSEIRGSVTSNTGEIKTLNDSVLKLQTDLSTMQVKFDETQRRLDDANNDLTAYADTIKKLDTKYIKDEEEFLRCQLIIDGVKEQGNRRPKSIVTNLLKDLEVDFCDADIKSAFRLGPINDKATRPRSIRVQFSTISFKYDIFKNIQKLKGKDAWRGVHIADAVSVEEQDRRRDLRCIYAAGKSKGVDVKLKGSNIIIDGVRFAHKDIHDLPKGLSIDKVKMVATRDGLAFQSHHSFLSNMYPVKIMCDGVEYKSSEHLYHTEMAKHYQRLDLVKSIIKAKDGYATKKIARDIVIADDWEETKLKVMRKVIQLKFDQNDNIRGKLLATVGHLYEATKGDSFSCGMTLAQAKDIAQDTIVGANHLGKILEEYRNNYTGQ